MIAPKIVLGSLQGDIWLQKNILFELIPSHRHHGVVKHAIRIRYALFQSCVTSDDIVALHQTEGMWGVKARDDGGLIGRLAATMIVILQCQQVFL